MRFGVLKYNELLKEIEEAINFYETQINTFKRVIERDPNEKHYFEKEIKKNKEEIKKLKEVKQFLKGGE